MSAGTGPTQAHPVLSLGFWHRSAFRQAAHHGVPASARLLAPCTDCGNTVYADRLANGLCWECAPIGGAA